MLNIVFKLISTLTTDILEAINLRYLWIYGRKTVAPRFSHEMEYGAF